MQDIIERLSPLEKRVLPVLRNGITVEELEAETKLTETEVLRALQWLENKKIIKLVTEAKEIVELDENGKIYADKGLPERILLTNLKDKALTLKEIREKTKLTDEEITISLGVLKSKAAVTIGKEEKHNQIWVKLNANGIELLEKELLEEKLLKKLEKEILDTKTMSDIEKHAFENLKKRKKIIKTDVVKEIKISLTELGENLIKLKLPEEKLIEVLTSKILREASWKGKKFRKYDIKINVPRVYAAKRHFVNQAIDYIKRIWLDLGFKEMRGPLLDTSFWNFDALFVPQDHPAREQQATFFIKQPKYGKLPEKNLVNSVRKTHENGWTTGSTGWKYKWDENEAKKLVLRTHTTILSARTIAKLKQEDLPAKFFSVGRCFRNETIDWKHSFEFTQVEGIVIDENANFRHLLGYLREYYNKLGFKKIRFRPSYFPYTEMSVEPEVFHPIKKEWIELGGAGIFRPEVVKPLLGKDVPVLAWGQGMERGIMDYFGITDFRDLYKNDLKQLKTIKLWLK